jgi:hypothetical protein
MNESKLPKPHNGMNYSHSELEADHALRARVKAQRAAAWDAGVIRQTIQCTDSLDSGKPPMAALT